jgi:hypothetical protein
LVCGGRGVTISLYVSPLLNIKLVLSLSSKIQARQSSEGNHGRVQTRETLFIYSVNEEVIDRFKKNYSFNHKYFSTCH